MVILLLLRCGGAQLCSHATNLYFYSALSSTLLVDDLQANLNTSQLRVKQLTSQEEERVDK